MEGRDDDLITTAEVARLLGVSKSSIEKSRVVGSPIPYRKVGMGGRAVRYRRQDVTKFIEANTHTSTSERPRAA